MVKRMSDDDVQNYVYSKMFGDLDGIEAHSLFDEDEGTAGMHEIEGTAENAEPASKESGGMKITIEPIMAGATEGEKPTNSAIEEDREDEEDDKYKGLSDMSPLMAQLHGPR